MVNLKDIGILLPKKVPKRKTCQILRKRGIFYSLLLNCITPKKFEILNSTITKIGMHSVHVGSLHHAIYQATKLGSLFC